MLIKLFVEIVFLNIITFLSNDKPLCSQSHMNNAMY